MKEESAGPVVAAAFRGRSSIGRNGGNSSPIREAAFHAIQRRQRTPLSCKECHRRKTKCDRKAPCSACIQRGVPNTCQYFETTRGHKKGGVAKGGASTSSSTTATSVGKGTKPSPGPTFTSEPIVQSPKSEEDDARHSIDSTLPTEKQQLKARIHKLENMIIGLISQINRSSPTDESSNESSQHQMQRQSIRSAAASMLQRQSPPGSQSSESSPQTPIDTVNTALGHLTISKDGRTRYATGTAWDNILDEIAEIKSVVEPIVSFNAIDRSIESTGFPFSAQQSVTKSDLLKGVPGREYSDYFIHEFFLVVPTYCPIVHAPSFKKKYADFWREPAQIDLSVLGMLFAALALGVGVCDSDDAVLVDLLAIEQTEQRSDLVAKYHNCAKQCLVQDAFFVSSKIEHLQTFVFLWVYHYCMDGDLNMVWPLYGMMIVMATGIGIHRDGQLFGLDTIQTETRRRIWSFLLQIDCLQSADFGRASLIQDGTFDALPPSDVNDEDITSTGVTVNRDVLPTDMTFSKLSIYSESVNETDHSVPLWTCDADV